MSDNVGLSTPRGSGTSGYVQRNLAHIKPRNNTPHRIEEDQLRHKQRQPDKSILEHDRKRQVEILVLKLRDELEEKEIADDEIDEQCDALRSKLLDDLARGRGPTGPDIKQLKTHQVHELSAAKIRETERMRRALGISAKYEEGSHWSSRENRATAPRQEQQ